MNVQEKREIVTQITMLLSQLVEADEEKTTDIINFGDKPVEMLTVKECTEVIKGLSEHTLRQLVAQGKIPYIRAGQGNRGKILISKTALIDYFNNVA